MAQKGLLPSVIRKYREVNNMTQEELSRRIHKSEKYIGMVECGRVNPSYPVLKEIVLALGIDGNMIFYENKNNELINVSDIYLRKMDIVTQKLAIEILQVMANSPINMKIIRNKSCCKK